VLGEVELDDLLSEREKLHARLQDILDKQTDRWGIKVSLVEQNTTVVFPIPIQMIEGLSGLLNKEKVEMPVARPREAIAVSRNNAN
jgi:hypothetical protein